MLQATIREALTPLLPPPVVRGIAYLDPLLEPYLGPEGATTLLLTLVMSWVTIFLVSSLSSSSWIDSFGSSSSAKGGAVTAIAQEDVDSDMIATSMLPEPEQFDATVLFCGPPSAGKTRLFFQLCYKERNLPTVTSLKANVGYHTEESKESDNDASTPATTTRYVDWPGHADLMDASLQRILEKTGTNKSSVPMRTVLVLDANQPIRPAAQVLYQLWARAAAVAGKNDSKIPVVVACHKSDFPKAKNPRRIKIQLRTELERLVGMRGVPLAGGKKSAATKEASLELDDLPFLELRLLSTSCEGGKGALTLQSYCSTGELPPAETAATPSTAGK